jgi:hypothetical protein
VPTSEVTINIPLELGWNLISFKVFPDSSDIQDALVSIQGRYAVVQTFDGTTLAYYPDSLLKESTLKTIDPYHGYWINMQQAATLTISGSPVADATPLHLKEGWNLISFLADGPLPVDTALSSIDGRYSAVLGYEGMGLSFYPTVPEDMNTLGLLRPGYGYWVKMSIAADLVYPSSE